MLLLFEKISEQSKTKKFCCVTDIQFKDLPEHAVYYGAAAIGFRAKAIHPKFLPVLYIPEENLPAMKVLAAPIAPTIEDAQVLRDFLSGPELTVDPRLSKQLREKHQREIEEYDPTLNEKRRQHKDEFEQGYLKDYLKITNFSTFPDQTFYRERGWRYFKEF